jgi:glycosyltransferase involved in cell wall biosynthesis
MKMSPVTAPVRPEPPVARRIKELLDGEVELLQKVEAMQSRLIYGCDDHIETFETDSWNGFLPDVSVVVSSFNYERFVSEAMESVTSSLGVAAELIVVDDHSQDNSVRVILDQMKTSSWFPIKLLAQSASTGVSVARNTAIAETRADRVFVLGGENVIYPGTLQKLSIALDRSPEAAFSYGIIHIDGSHELLSHLPWDVRRLTESNYIDAMAMVRRQIWDEVGGYDPMLSTRGGEDYEFWLRLAARGVHAAFVPEFLGHYRVRDASRQHTLNLDTFPLTEELRNRYPLLPWDRADSH